MPAPRSTAVSSIVNLLNNVIGAGLFSMPWCLAQSTVLSGALVFVIICVLNVYSFVLLAQCCALTGCYSYLDIGKAALGPRFGVVAQCTALLYACGSLISYVVLAGNFLLGEGTGVLALEGHSSFLAHGGIGARLVVGAAFSALFFLPLSLLRSLDSLKVTSWLALAATLYAGFITLYELVASPAGSLTPAEEALGRTALRASVQPIGLPLSVFAAVPIINVAFTAHYNGPRYFEELHRRSVARYAMVSGVALVGSLLVYLSVGVSGYLSFGNLTKGDVLENFADTYPLAVGARGALLIVLISCYPKVQHSVRDGLLRLLAAPGQTTDLVPFRTLAACTAGIVALSTVIGTLVNKVEVVLAYKGAIFGSLMVYVWPALMHAALILQRRKPLGDLGDLGDTLAPEPPLLEAIDHPTLHPTLHLHPARDAPQITPQVAPKLSRAYPPQSVSAVLIATFTTRHHMGPALLLTWGVLTGVLGVAITIQHQFF